MKSVCSEENDWMEIFIKNLINQQQVIIKAESKIMIAEMLD